MLYFFLAQKKVTKKGASLTIRFTSTDRECHQACVNSKYF